MNLIIARDEAGFDRAAEKALAASLKGGARTILTATGNTPLRAYHRLAVRHDRGELDTKNLRVFQLDAYEGEGKTGPGSLYAWSMQAFARPLGIPAERVRRLNGSAPDPEAECAAYDADVQAAGGIDLAILGLGPNGHLGFNEPPSRPDAPTRRVALSPESLASNAGYWPNWTVPTHALTAGLSVILAARQIVLLARGEAKREILHAALRGPRTPEVPASWLQGVRERVTVITDLAAWPEGSA